MQIKIMPLGELQANSYILTHGPSGETALIDCGECTPQLVSELEKCGLEKIKYILLTHGHFDHIFGVPDVKRLTGVPVMVHKDDADCLFDENRSLAHRYFPGEQELFRADRLLEDGDVLSLGGQEIRVLHTPGHSKGSVCYVCGNLIFSGDTLFSRTVGRTDFPGGSVDELGQSVKKLFALPGDYIVYPGHHRLTTMETERKTNRFLRNQDVFGDR
ncbi:MAG: MBL fold metallo-hydrolase [Oscillospiraceae bacterium]|jgi:glyoxylase-like metal-dependent hydrolase (beta-lactamase superfamily II)|nr:MBL fold metallo-hydrolase [Oscillospiraceae bacterium]